MTKTEVGVYFNENKSRLHFVYIDVDKLFNGDKSELYDAIKKSSKEDVNIDKIEYHPESDLVKIVCYVSTKI